MNMFEEARALRGMISMCSLTQSQIAKQMGVSQSYVANKIRLLNFSDYAQMLILKAALTERHARVLLKIKDEERLRTAIEKIRTMHLSVAASEAMVDNMLLDDMPKTLGDFAARDRLCRFEEIISESVKNLVGYGYKVKQKTDYYGNKKYITVCIEE